MRIYLDHNILDALSKNRMTLQVPSDTVWVYSNENFNEIKRSKNMRFLDVLANLKARMLELEFDKNFMLTERAFLYEFRDPHELYSQWLDRINEVPIDDAVQLQMQFLARIAGANNQDEMLLHSVRLREFLYSLLSPHDLITNDIESRIEQVVKDIEIVTTGQLLELQHLEHSRTSIGIGRGRVGNLSVDDNPLKLIWEIMRNKYPGMTIEQFYGFDPIDKQGYEKWPRYLGVIGCHTVLNFLGFHPDKGLNSINKIPGILSDANHTAMATYCDAVMSQDQRFCAKARAIFEYLELDIAVIEAIPKVD